MYGLSQLIECPTRITCNTSTLIEHILINTPGKISQSGVIATAISDHFLIYRTRRIPKAKYKRHKKITFCSLQNYLADVYKEIPERASFLNYENFDNPDIAYSDFITRFDCVMNTSHGSFWDSQNEKQCKWMILRGNCREYTHTGQAVQKINKSTKSRKMLVDEETHSQFKN